MHRLREWFGVKDWTGPPQNVQKTSHPTTINDDETNQNKDIKTMTEDVNAKVSLSTQKFKTIPENLKQVAVPDKQNSVFAKAEQWLKQYIPHKEGTCFGCKLVAMGAILSYTIFIGSMTITQSKKFNSNYRRLYVLTGFSATFFGLSFLTVTFYDQNPMEVFKTSENDED